LSESDPRDETEQPDAAETSEVGATDDGEPNASAAPETPSATSPADEPAVDEPAVDEPAVDAGPERPSASDSDELDSDELETDELETEEPVDEEHRMDWYILKVAFNREDSIRDALDKRVKLEGMEEYFGEIIVPTEDVVEFTRAGKRRVTKRKLLPGYLMVNMAINDDTWFLVRETSGISDFTGSAGKPMPMDSGAIDRFIKKPVGDDEEPAPMKTAIPFKSGDRVRVKEGNFQNQEGEVDAVDEATGRVTVIINIFGRSVPMELDHWQIEDL
jgi:transcriptional antiterminator NusG